MSLDRVDLKILDILQEDGKISNTKLASPAEFRIMEYKSLK